MALDLQRGFHPPRAACSDSTPTATARPASSRDNSSTATVRHPDNDGQIDLSGTSTAPPPPPGETSTAQWLASARDAVHHASSPINGDSAIWDEGSKEETRNIDKAMGETGGVTPPMSTLDSYFKNRKTSISFDPRVKLDSGHQTALEQPLPKLAVDTAFNIRPLLHGPLQDSTRSPLVRAYSEADSNSFNSETGERKDIQSHPTPPTDTASACPIPASTTRAIPIDQSQANLTAGGSLTSESTASSGVPEARTPIEDNMETCVISPITAFPPFYQPTSLEDTSAWPKPRRQVSAYRSQSYSNEFKLNRRPGSRHSSTASRRSTSSAMSPATAFLSRFARDEPSPRVERDGEGQEMGQYILGKQIGFGGFSVVREAYTLEGEERVVRAVKIVRKQVAGKEERENDQLQAEFEHEINLWKALGHRHILPLLDVHVDDFATYCFTKLNTGGTLFDVVRNSRKGVSQQLTRRYSYQLASAVRYLHEDMHIVHRDIKLENCLIDVSLESAAKDGGNLLLCDFGLAEFDLIDDGDESPDPYTSAADRPKPRNLGPSDTSTSIAGSLQYASPELIMSPAGFLSSVVDMWAFGVVVYALLVGDLPFQHTFQPRVQMMILAGEWDQERLKKAAGTQGMEDEVLDILHGCLNMNSDGRWNIATVLKSGWLEGCQEMLEEISEQWKL
ncbi:MAG: hypothetical protein Q9220_003617 [cf. Caloplaca sp. 1 TL-2023]